MTRLMKKKDRRKYDSITVNLSKWMVDSIAKISDNRSAYIGAAVVEYFDFIEPFYMDKESGSITITYSSSAVCEIYEKINELCIEKYEMSRSELTRNAVRRRLLKDLKVMERKEGKHIIESDNYIRIPNYNGGKPVRKIGEA